MELAGWAVAEMAGARLGDPRRQRRAAEVLSVLAARPEASIPQACGSWAMTKALYRFWDNATIAPDALLGGHRAATCARCASEATVLAIQDTTTLDFSRHAALTGTGPLGHGQRTGLHVHSVLAVSVAGVPLGLLDQAVWARDATRGGSRHQRRQRTTPQKESQRWLTGVAVAQTVLPAPTRIVSIADREADIFDLFALPRPPHSDLLIRSAHDRRVQGDPSAYLWPTVRAAPLLGAIEITVPRQAGRPHRQAQLTLQVAAVTLQPPRSRQHDHALAPLPVTAVLAAEPDPPAGVTPLCWLLLTTLPIDDLAAAVRCVSWYRHRWSIERFHYVLKSGGQIEQLQLQTAARIARALATLSIVAWRLLWLTEQARVTPDLPCTVVLTDRQWAALYAMIHQTTAPPPAPVSLACAVHWIAQLGGFLGRRADGEPGVTTLWRGWDRLETITATWAIAHPPPADPTCG